MCCRSEIRSFIPKRVLSEHLFQVLRKRRVLLFSCNLIIPCENRWLAGLSGSWLVKCGGKLVPITLQKHPELPFATFQKSSTLSLARLLFLVVDEKLGRGRELKAKEFGTESFDTCGSQMYLCI